ncbi:MAG TPA: hypothetical protein VNH64_10595 [Parvularculaceae bacterium]|nr:hypothetical protein [Parvularculaceae bacterium]
MMKATRGFGALVVMGLFMTGACETDDASSEAGSPAVLVSADVETMAKVKLVLADAMGKANVELGPGDPTETSTISVLPPRPTRYESMSTATPTQFDIVLKGSRCFVVRRDTGEAYELKGVSCRAAKK